MGRFTDGNHPGNGKNKQGKGNFETTENGDHILGTPDDDTGTSEGATAIDVPGVGDNLIDLKGGDDLFNGFAGNDRAFGNTGNDNLNGHDGDDVLGGGDGDDNISGGEGADELYGGAGNDLIEGGADGDYIDGGDDNDTASYASSDAAVDVNLLADTASGGHADGDELDNIENLIGSAFDDTLTGDAGANVIDGGDGADSITGGDGADTLIGGDGGDNDTINAGTSGAANGRDQDVDVIVAAATFAENGTDAVFNYEESTFPGLTTDDIFDFSAFIDFTDATMADDDELANFLTYVEDVTDPATQNSTVGQIQDNLGNVWFNVSELDSSTAFNGAESVTVLVDGTAFVWDAAANEWDLA